MSFSKETLNQVARLSRLSLSAAEMERLSVQLQDIITFIDSLASADVSGVEPADRVLSARSVLRADEPGVCLSPDAALQNAPDRQGAFFGVPKVIE